MDNYLELYEYHSKKQRGTCPICRLALIKKNDPIEIHHRFHKPRSGKLARKINKKFAIFIDSTLNTMLLHKSCHTANRSYKAITINRVERIVEWLKNRPILIKKINFELDK